MKHADIQARNEQIIAKWHKGTPVKELARIWKVTPANIYHIIHQYVKYDNPVYYMLLKANGKCDYSKTIVTKAYMAVKRYFPYTYTVEDFLRHVSRSEFDNMTDNYPISQAVSKLLLTAWEMESDSSSKRSSPKRSKRTNKKEITQDR